MHRLIIGRPDTILGTDTALIQSSEHLHMITMSMMKLTALMPTKSPLGKCHCKLGQTVKIYFTKGTPLWGE